MDSEYFQPETFLVGGKYYLRKAKNGRGIEFQEVELIGYRPHPGELLVRDSAGSRKIYRLDLYQKEGPDEVISI